jgi:hypothetical protein
MAVQMNGTDQGLSIGGARGQFRNVAAGTIALWARLESAFAATDRILVKFTTGTGANTTRVSLGLSTTLGVQVACRILDTDTISSHQIVLGTPPAVGEWHHYLVTFDFTLKRFYLYYDGILANSTQMTNPTAGNTSDTASLAGVIGFENPATPNRFWPGSLDDVVTLNRLVGPAEAQTICNSRGRAFILDGITGHWPFAEGHDGVAIATAADVTGQGGSASPVGAPVYIGGLTQQRRRRKPPSPRR